MVLTALHIDDNPSWAKEFEEMYQKAGIKVIFVRSVRGAIKATAHKHYDLVCTDLQIIREHKRGILTPLEFLNYYHKQNPTAVLTVVAAVNFDTSLRQNLSGIHIVPKLYSKLAFPAFLENFVKSPTKMQRQAEINLKALHRGVMHTAAGGRKRLIKLIKRAQNDEVLRWRLIMGWRPLHKGDLAAGLFNEIKEKQQNPPLEGSAFAKELQREQRLANALKKLNRK